ncbi:MAG TPA: hypothetical protein VI434_03630 [Candidatus Dormibacteraeota bacterium]
MAGRRHCAPLAVGSRWGARHPGADWTLTTAALGSEKHVFGEVIEHLLSTAVLAEERPRWWGEIFVPGMMLPHVALFVDQCPVEDTPVHLHRLRNFFHADQAVHPSLSRAAASTLTATD